MRQSLGADAAHPVVMALATIASQNVIVMGRELTFGGYLEPFDLGQDGLEHVGGRAQQIRAWDNLQHLVSN